MGNRSSSKPVLTKQVTSSKVDRERPQTTHLDKGAPFSAKRAIHTAQALNYLLDRLLQ